MNTINSVIVNSVADSGNETSSSSNTLIEIIDIVGIVKIIDILVHVVLYEKLNATNVGILVILLNIVKVLLPFHKNQMQQCHLYLVTQHWQLRLLRQVIH